MRLPRLHRLLRSYLLAYLPEGTKRRLKSAQLRKQRKRVFAYPSLGKQELRRLLCETLRVPPGGVVFVHSSLDLLHFDGCAEDVLAVLRGVVGSTGTLAFPTFPRSSMYECLRRHLTFDVRRTPSYSGLLSEVARRQAGSIRSMQPVRSVAAIGPQADYLTRSHHLSPYPFDEPSPFSKLRSCGAQIVGLGVSSKNMTFVHVVDDYLKGALVRHVYHRELFHAHCIDARGNTMIVPSYAHRMSGMSIDVPAFLKDFVSAETAEDCAVGPMRFFRADAQKLFERLLWLARAGRTIYNS